MRVAFDSQAFTMQEYGGVSRYICSLAKELSLRDEVNPRIFAPLYINTYLPDVPSDLVLGHKIPRIPKTGRIFSAISRLLERPAISRFHPDIVHETYFNARSPAPRGVQTVVTVYDMINEIYSAEFSKHDRNSTLKRMATQRADHILCISESTRKDLLEIFDVPEEKVSVVYLGVDNLITTTPSDKIQNIKPYILYVGHRGGYKNFEGFLRAYASSLWLSNNFNVVCFGGSPFSSDERKNIESLGLDFDQFSQINGSDSKLASHYQAAALFVYPSLYEGFGIPPLEAMSLNCPVACSNNSSIPEVVGDAGEYFDPMDIDSIRAAMEQVLNSDVRITELIERGRLRCSHFSWERCADETLAVYRSLL